MRSDYGAIRALQQMRRHASPGIDSSVRHRSLERGAQATTLLSDLLGLLPSGQQMAVILGAVYSKRLENEGMTPEVRKLRDAAHQIERTLNACRAYSLSKDTSSVEEAVGVANAIVSAHPEVPMAVTPGDHISTNYLGAMIAATYGNGSRWELNLRRSHPEYEEMEEGVWLLEGGGFMATGAIPCIEVNFGDVLPANIREIVAAQVMALHRNSSAHLRLIHAAAR